MRKIKKRCRSFPGGVRFKGLRLLCDFTIQKSGENWHHNLEGAVNHINDSNIYEFKLSC